MVLAAFLRPSLARLPAHPLPTPMITILLTVGAFSGTHRFIRIGKGGQQALVGVGWVLAGSPSTDPGAGVVAELRDRLCAPERMQVLLGGAVLVAPLRRRRQRRTERLCAQRLPKLQHLRGISQASLHSEVMVDVLV